MAATSPLTSYSNTAFVGRQPIFCSELNVFGYELLFRTGDAIGSASVSDGDFATASVVVTWLTDFGIDAAAGSKLGFVNLTRNLLLNADLSCLPKDRVVLEVLEDIEPDRKVLAAIERLAAEGYRIALDDFVYRPSLKPLIQLADFVKIEYPLIPRSEVRSHIEQLRDLGVPTILAEKLETYDDFELCRELGCDLFQGFFFCRPQVLKHPKVEPAGGTVLRIISKLQDPHVSIAEVAAMIQADATLSYKVLRFVNSAGFKSETEIQSIEQAATLLGLRRLRSLASIMWLASIEGTKPDELTKTAMIRAKACELLAEHEGHVAPDRCFTVGLLSVMDALLDMSMENIVDQLPIAQDMKDALLFRTGSIGELLDRVLSGRAGDVCLDAIRWAFDFERSCET